MTKRYNIIWYISLFVILVVIGLATGYYIDKNAKDDTDDKPWIIFVLIIGALATIVFGWSWYKCNQCRNAGKTFISYSYDATDKDIVITKASTD